MNTVRLTFLCIFLTNPAAFLCHQLQNWFYVNCLNNKKEKQQTKRTAAQSKQKHLSGFFGKIPKQNIVASLEKVDQKLEDSRFDLKLVSALVMITSSCLL